LTVDSWQKKFAVRSLQSAVGGQQLKVFQTPQTDAIVYHIIVYSVDLIAGISVHVTNIVCIVK
jgi:hypothetical protein